MTFTKKSVTDANFSEYMVKFNFEGVVIGDFEQILFRRQCLQLLSVDCFTNANGENKALY